MDTSSIKYGMGVTREVGFDMKSLGARRVMVVVDPALLKSETTSIALKALADEGIDAVVYEGVHIEPTDVSFKEAIHFAVDGGFDGYVSNISTYNYALNPTTIYNMYMSGPQPISFDIWSAFNYIKSLFQTKKN